MTPVYVEILRDRQGRFSVGQAIGGVLWYQEGVPTQLPVSPLAVCRPEVLMA